MIIFRVLIYEVWPNLKITLHFYTYPVCDIIVCFNMSIFRWVLCYEVQIEFTLGFSGLRFFTPQIGLASISESYRTSQRKYLLSTMSWFSRMVLRFSTSFFAAGAKNVSNLSSRDICRIEVFNLSNHFYLLSSLQQSKRVEQKVKN